MRLILRCVRGSSELILPSLPSCESHNVIIIEAHAPSTSPLHSLLQSFSSRFPSLTPYTHVIGQDVKSPRAPTGPQERRSFQKVLLTSRGLSSSHQRRRLLAAAAAAAAAATTPHQLPDYCALNSVYGASQLSRFPHHQHSQRKSPSAYFATRGNQVSSELARVTRAVEAVSSG